MLARLHSISRAQCSHEQIIATRRFRKAVGICVPETTATELCVLTLLNIEGLATEPTWHKLVVRMILMRCVRYNFLCSRAEPMKMCSSLGSQREHASLRSHNGAHALSVSWSFNSVGIAGCAGAIWLKITCIAAVFRCLYVYIYIYIYRERDR